MSTSPELGSDMQSQDSREVRHCVTAIVDLLGFSSHLETGGNDVRTTIGREAITRLQTLEQALNFLRCELATCAFAYPDGLTYHRINDAIILNLDLPEFLTPGVGETAKRFSVLDLGAAFHLSRYDGDQDDERFMADFSARVAIEAQPLIKFVGLAARLHLFVNLEERQRVFAGAKTICATGFRRRFVQADGAEDMLAANFAFANAFLADRELHGARLYLDDNVTRLLCADSFARNLVRFACFVERSKPFDPIAEYREDLSLDVEHVLSDAQKTEILRRAVFFRELNARPLTYLQVVQRLRPYLSGDKQPVTSAWPAHILKRISIGPNRAATHDGGAPDPLVYPISIASDIRVFPEVIESGTSITMNKDHRHTETGR